MTGAERDFLLRLTPDRALRSVGEAHEFLRERGMLSLLPRGSLPSLFGACHEPPYAPGKPGFGQYPRTKWRWAGELERRPGVLYAKLLRGTGLFLSEETAALADSLCRAELVRAEEGVHGEAAALLVRRLADAGPSLLDDLRAELTIDLRAVRRRLEPLGAIVARSVVLEPHRHTSELARWDQLWPESSARGGLAELLVAGVNAAVAAPENEARSWFTWRAAPELVERLVADGRIVRERGVLVTP